MPQPRSKTKFPSYQIHFLVHRLLETRTQDCNDFFYAKCSGTPLHYHYTLQMYVFGQSLFSNYLQPKTYQSLLFQFTSIHLKVSFKEYLFNSFFHWGKSPTINHLLVGSNPPAPLIYCVWACSLAHGCRIKYSWHQ